MATQRSKTKRQAGGRSARPRKPRDQTTTKASTCIAYCRISSSRHQKNLEAQRAVIHQFLASRDRKAKLIAEFIEEEGSQPTRRPELTKAIDLAHRSGAYVLIANVEDLLRNAAFLTILRDSPRGVRFRCADMPKLDRSNLSILARVAENSRKRTRAALSAARERGIKFGNPAGGKAFSPEARKRGNKKSLSRIRSDMADVVQSLAPILNELRKVGFTTGTELARQLNKRKVLSPSDARRAMRKEEPLGIAWHPQTVVRVLSKMDNK
jgi:DNA invertase Pin-like site-specific DNA recombinase